MPQRDKSAHTSKQKRPEAQPRAWAAVNKANGSGMKTGAGRKIPSGPVGGTGRKTNLARSS